MLAANQSSSYNPQMINSSRSNFLQAQTNQNNAMKVNQSHLKGFMPNKGTEDKTQNVGLKLRNSSNQIGQQQLNNMQAIKLQNLPAIKTGIEVIQSAQRSNNNVNTQPSSPSNIQMERNASQELRRYQSSQRLPTGNSQSEQGIQNQKYMKHSHSSFNMVSDSGRVHKHIGRSMSTQDLQNVDQQNESQDPFKTYHRSDRQQQGVLMYTHPVTGEPIVMDKQDLLANTQKNPFQNSVRDTTNYYFHNQKEHEKYLDTKNSPQKTFNRRMKLRNSYMVIFPSYGLHENKKIFQATQFSQIGTKLENAEEVDHQYFVKVDYMKKYYEEMLKAKNMRMNKK
ncbi:UNKNOWN [Stylonychia lemnae]|uniref:Uncharacterized protein n=1 Tax=Stylonychia lemnae TaxID=5949 RepID=A0A078AP28_STYLE|nr:UNKNOWN [Stylonychia lemnae]|eukprot:CDW83072.1 UNKNOWN [Stylonychia lemnae]